MTLANGLMIVAVLIAPFAAVWAQRKLDALREQRLRKLGVFKTLMATRGTPLSVEHVQALNMIELEFADKSTKDQRVRDAWREYLDHLDSPFPRDGDDLTARQEAWSGKAQGFLAELLKRMGDELGYALNAVQVKRGAYTPQAHGFAELELQIIRSALAEWLAGKHPVQVSVVPEDEKARETGREIADEARAFLRGKTPINVVLTPQSGAAADAHETDAKSDGTGATRGREA
jgi:hypothetical protein